MIKALTIVLAVIFLISGGAKLAGLEMMQQQFQNWGYSVLFMYLVGAFEVVSAVLLLLQSTRFYAAILIMVVMAGAIFTHVRAGELPLAVVPLLILFLAAVIARRTGTPAMASPSSAEQASPETQS